MQTEENILAWITVTKILVNHLFQQQPSGLLSQQCQICWSTEALPTQSQWVVNCIETFKNTDSTNNTNLLLSIKCTALHQHNSIKSRSTLWAFSSGSPPLIRMPLVAPTPVPTMTAVGVARPSAHGHAMHKTVVANWNACSNTDSDKVRPRF